MGKTGRTNLFTSETLFRTLAEHLGIEYVYGESIKSIEPSAVIRDLSPDHLPVGWLEQLYQLVYEQLVYEAASLSRPECLENEPI